MIRPSSPSASLRASSPLRSPGPASPRPAGDGFGPSASPTPGLYGPRPQWRAEPANPRSLWKTGLWAAATTASALAGLAALPAQAQAAETRSAGPEQSTAALKDEGLKLLLTSRAAAGQSTPVEQALASLAPEAARLLRTLPTAAQQAYADLEPEAKAWLNQRIQGKTSAALGLIQIDNREAFINGTAVGQDVFAIARKALARQVRQGRVPGELQSRLEGVVDLLAQLSPQQRANLVGALEADLTSR